MCQLIILLILLDSLQRVHGVTLKFTIEEKLTDCKGWPSFDELYDNNITVEQINDDTLELNGVAIVKPGLKANLPLSFTLTSEYYDRGSWIPGPGFSTSDFCGEMVNPLRSWADLVQTFGDAAKWCLHKAGTVYRFDRLRYDTTIRNAQPVFLGDWRAKVTMDQIGIGHSKKYCCMAALNIANA